MAVCGIVHTFILHKSSAHLFYLVIPVSSFTLFLNFINTSSQGDNRIYTIAAARVLPQIFYLAIAFIVYRYTGASSEKMLLLSNGISMIVLLLLILQAKPDFCDLKETFLKLNAENKKYGLQVYYGSLANVSVQYVAGFTLGLWAEDNANVGFYTLALTMSMPLTMLPNIIGTTYFKKFANMEQIPKKVLRIALLLSVFFLGVFVLLIGPIVNVLYNKSYHIVALYSSVLAIGFTFHGMADMINRFLSAHGKGIYLRNSAFMSGSVSLLGYTIGIYAWGICGAIATRIACSMIYFVTMCYYYRLYMFTRKDD